LKEKILPLSVERADGGSRRTTKTIEKRGNRKEKKKKEDTTMHLWGSSSPATQICGKQRKRGGRGEGEEL